MGGWTRRCERLAAIYDGVWQRAGEVPVPRPLASSVRGNLGSAGRDVAQGLRWLTFGSAVRLELGVCPTVFPTLSS